MERDRSLRSDRSVDSNLSSEVRRLAAASREWDYEIEISGRQLTLRERKPRPGYEQLQEGKATMSRGERFARPSVHLAINFAHKACLPRQLSARPVLSSFFLFLLSFLFFPSHFLSPRGKESSLSLQFSFNPPLQLVSSTTLDTFLLFDTRTQSNPGPSRIHPYDLV